MRSKHSATESDKLPRKHIAECGTSVSQHTQIRLSICCASWCTAAWRIRRPERCRTPGPSPELPNGADHQFQHAAGGAGGASLGVAPAVPPPTPGCCILVLMWNRTKKLPRRKSPASVSPSPVNRRDFIKTTSLAAGALALGVPTLLRGQNLNSKLNIACIGIGGKGRSDTDACAGENIVALCDVDAGSEAYATQTQKYPSAKFYKDFRQMLDQMGSGIDAVTVSTPDHMHAIVASAAMKMHKAVFCQKPLTQTVYEARYLRNMAKEKKLVTQMGNQGSAADGLRRAVETIQDGLIGQVHQIHVWTNRPIWQQIGRASCRERVFVGV